MGTMRAILEAAERKLDEMAAPKSAKVLAQLLKDNGFVDEVFSTKDLRGNKKVKGPKVRGISDETYGKNSFLYIHVTDMDVRAELEQLLASNGFKVERRYSPGEPTVEVQVGFFKGWHWDE